MRADRVFAYGAALGFLGDLVAGDPRRGHPVAAFGRAAQALERRLWRDDRGAGAVYAALCAGGAVAAAALAEQVVRNSAALRVALTAAATWTVLGGTSLAREAQAIGAALQAGDLDAARDRLPHLCGRDPQALDAQGIARAVVESVAENTSDAVVGALVWGGVCGVPGLAGYRAVNTLDAMVGHRSARYRRFGWAAARLDDLAGFPAARLTAALTVLAGPDPRGALRTWRRDGRRHPSPNAGPVEAAFAGALTRRLGGTLSYAGRVEHRPALGAEHPPVDAADIVRAVRLSRRVNALALAASVLTSTAVHAGLRAASAKAAARRTAAQRRSPAVPDRRPSVAGATPDAVLPRRRTTPSRLIAVAAEKSGARAPGPAAQRRSPAVPDRRRAAGAAAGVDGSGRGRRGAWPW